VLTLAFATVLAASSGNVFPDALLVQNGGPVLDVTRPPTGIRPARGDGKTDDTEALCDVFDWLKAKYQLGNGFDNEYHYYVYLPNGTYRVTDTLIYRGKTIGAYPKWDGTFDINHLHFVGQSEQGTKIRLDDAAPGFDNRTSPKSVLALQHPDTVFNNVPGSNWVRDLTIDVGARNPGVGEGGPWNLIVRETRAGQRKELLRSSLPRRGGTYRDDLSVVRFVGGS